jgi:hypothetical protein
MRIGLLIVGILVTLFGLLWIGQGSGYFPYPAGNFMINEAPWMYRGIGLAVVGVILIAVSRAIGRARA